eukprot:245089_1
MTNNMSMVHPQQPQKQQSAQKTYTYNYNQWNQRNDENQNQSNLSIIQQVLPKPVTINNNQQQPHEQYQQLQNNQMAPMSQQSPSPKQQQPVQAPQEQVHTQHIVNNKGIKRKLSEMEQVYNSIQPMKKTKIADNSNNSGSNHDNQQKQE